MATPTVKCPSCDLVQQLPAIGPGGMRWCAGRHCTVALDVGDAVAAPSALERPVTLNAIASAASAATKAVRALAARTTTERDLAAAADAARAAAGDAFATGLAAGRRRSIAVLEGLRATYVDGSTLEHTDQATAALVMLIDVAIAAINLEVK